jgi:hypothetical protein
MRTLLFTFTLVLYGFSATDMHEWVRVPQVFVHLLEHHSAFGHHDAEHSQDDAHDGDHDPFDDGCHEVFCACTGALFLPLEQGVVLSVRSEGFALGSIWITRQLEGFSGSAWNPPKQA